jgi:hypothetical protein
MIKVWDADVPCSVFKTRVGNHHEVKNRVLDLISSCGIPHSAINGDQISKTDWYSKENQPYLGLIEPVLRQHVERIAKKLNVNAFNITHVWFQQYKTDDRHNWHMHPECMFSGVYYLELPNDSVGTSFMHMGKEFTLNVSEGEIIMFPSFLLHRSKPNTSKNNKTVIAFNFNAFPG